MILKETMMTNENSRRLILEHARRLAAERAAERKIIRAIGYIGVVLAGIVIGLALYDIAEGDFPAASATVIGSVLVLIGVRRLQFWNIRRKAMKM